MSELFVRICQLFCCPPRPSHIVAKLAFLPPTPTYSFINSADDSVCRIELKPESGWNMTDDINSRIQVFFTYTKRNSRVACVHILANSLISSPLPNMYGRHGGSSSNKKSSLLSASCPALTNDLTSSKFGHSLFNNSLSKPTYTVLFSHGNAVDIGQIIGFLQSLAYRYNVNIMSYDYSGYGVSSGQRLEENVYADADAALNEIIDRFGLPLDRIVLYGQSIGTAPTIELATKYKVAGVILHSPLMSGLRVICPGTTRRFCFDPFTNIDKVSLIQSPTLIIHGTDDEIIGIHHGRELYSRLNYPLEPAWIEGAGHNDIEFFSDYAIRLDRFFNEDLKRCAMISAQKEQQQQQQQYQEDSQTSVDTSPTTNNNNNNTVFNSTPAASGATKNGLAGINTGDNQVSCSDSLTAARKCSRASVQNETCVDHQDLNGIDNGGEVFERNKSIASTTTNINENNSNDNETKSR